jgi:uncharacterized SAM-binding protein YcdF (DUF218 family)
MTDFVVSQRTFIEIIREPGVPGSLIFSALVLLVTGGLSLLASWLWVVRWALARGHEPVSGVVLVCGHRLEAGQPSADYRKRLKRAAELAHANPQLQLMLLGGGTPSEAGVGRNWLLQHTDLAAARIETEEESVDSLENLRQARALLGPQARISLLSSRYHLGRLRVFSRQLGLQAELVPAEPAFRPSPRNLARTALEAMLLCWFVSGRVWARLARKESLLERIR